jgi:hydroxymethylpyrimidine/phosphomethylpyrimidine kinase
MTSGDRKPVLLSIAGHDPCGGAGIQADAESARAAGIHAATVISCLTSQDTCGVRAVWPQPAERVEEQCRSILADSRVGAVKIGLLGSSAVIRVLSRLADEHADLPWVLDPVLAAGGGEPLTDAALLNQLRNNLLGRCTLITPNLPEARTLSCATRPDNCAGRLLETGCPWVLISGTHGDTPHVINRLYGRDGSYREWSWPRLPGEYHGSGCTLAGAIAARLVCGLGMVRAVEEAQAYTWRSLEKGMRIGRCQLIPNRLHELDGEEVPEA